MVNPSRLKVISLFIAKAAGLIPARRQTMSQISILFFIRADIEKPLPVSRVLFSRV
jgi:hypothetical protein